MESTTNTENTILKTAAQLATITIAVVAVLTTLGAMLLFVIHAAITSDISPRLERLEISQIELTTRVERVETRLDSVETRLNGVETRLGDVETRLGHLEAGQQEILKLLTANQSYSGSHID